MVDCMLQITFVYSGFFLILVTLFLILMTSQIMFHLQEPQFCFMGGI